MIIPEKIKNEMLSDATQYNIRLHFPNGERTDICNNMIVNNSAKLTESLCSQDSLKFGLCESPTFECETVGVGNIKDATFELTYEVLCDSSVTGAEWRTDLQRHVFPISKGTFVVASCERQADMQHRKIVAYGGGGATNWEMPESEAYKMRNWSTENRNYTYTPDLYKLIQTFFECEKVEEVSTTESIERNHSVPIPIRGNTFYYAWISRHIHNPENDTIYRETYNVTCDPIECLIESAKNLIPDITKIELNVLKNSFNNTLYKKNSKNNRCDSSGYFKEGTNFYYNSIDSENDDIYYFCGLRCSIGGQSVKNYYRDNIKIYKVGDYSFSYPISVTYANREKYLQTDLEKMAQALFELFGKIGRINGQNVLELIDIKKQYYLLPNDDLMPSTDLKPLGVNGSSIGKSQYSSLWYEEEYTKPFGAVYCSYKNTSNADAELIVYLDGYNAESDVSTYQTYDLSDNAIIQESTYTESQMTSILQAIAESIGGVSYVPVKLKCVSVPFVECGDTLEVLTQNNDSITTIVLKRVLSGESYVTDEITNV